MVTTNIVPGEGIDNNFVLGSSLYDTVSRMRKYKEPLKISYSSKAYLDTPILVTLPNLAVRLMFHSSGNQELMLIEVLDFSHSKLCYKGTYLNDIVYTYPSDEELYTNGQNIARKKQVLPCTLKHIYNKVFGPTFPGILDWKRKTYILSYPGIAFRFSINLADLLGRVLKLTDSNDVLSALTNWDQPTDILCQSLSIYKGESYPEFHQRLRLLLRSNLVNYEPKVSEITVKNVKVDLERGIAELERSLDGPLPAAVLTIGRTTQQDIIRLLGPPDACFNTFDSRLLIHKHLKTIGVSCENPGSVYKLHNYFRHGIDYLYILNAAHQSGGVLEKIIIHNGGIAESMDFLQWNKCNWKILTGTESPSVVDSSMYFSDFGSDFLEKVDKNKTGPVLLNRNESEIVSGDDMEFVELPEIERLLINLLSLDSCENYKTWGQLKLYGFDRCIFEVVSTNNCVSIVTVY